MKTTNNLAMVFHVRIPNIALESYHLFVFCFCFFLSGGDGVWNIDTMQGCPNRRCRCIQSYN